MRNIRNTNSSRSEVACTVVKRQRFETLFTTYPPLLGLAIRQENADEDPVFAFELACLNGELGSPHLCSQYGDMIYAVSPYNLNDLRCQACETQLYPIRGYIIDEHDVYPVDHSGGDALHDGLEPELQRELENKSIADATGGYCHRDDCDSLVPWDKASIVLNRSYAYCSLRCAERASGELDEEITEVCLHDPQGQANREGIRLDRQNETNVWRFVVNHEETLAAISSFRERHKGPFRVFDDEALHEMNNERGQ